MILNSDNSERKMILISAGQMSAAETIRIKDIEFDLVVSETEDTVYLLTVDKDFMTPEGFSVGTKFGQLDETSQLGIFEESGWGYYVTLNSGWKLGFCEGTSCTDYFPADSSRVKWIFKRP